MGGTYTLLLSFIYLASGVFIFLLGLTILRTGQSSSPTRATALILFFAGVGPILSASSIILQGTIKQDAVVYRSMVENFEYLWEFYFPSLLLFSLAYPRESRFFPNFPVLGLIVFAPYIFHLITIMAGQSFSKSLAELSTGLPVGREISVGERTFSLAGIGNVISAILATLVKLHKQLFLVVNVVYATIALYFLARSRRLNINPRISGQLRTVLLGLAVSTFGYVLAKLIRLYPGTDTSENTSLALINLSLLAGGGSVAYAVVKQQFLGIKYVTRKSTLYGAAAVLFAVVYLTVVKPVSDYFGQYSMVGKEAFETGFIIVAIIVFQPVISRIEEVLERILLKGKDDIQSKFKDLGGEISNVTNEEDLATRLERGLHDILDASAVSLAVAPDDARSQRLIPVLERIGGPISRRELLKLGERGRLPGQEDEESTSRKRRARRGLARARVLAGNDEVLVPILKNKQCIGYLALGEKTYGLRYGAEELAPLAVLATQISVALDNIRLLRENVEREVLEEELQMARRIQSQLLPDGSPSLPGYQLSGSTVPSRHVGGDYYDFELIDEDSLSLVIADVSGKGIPASLLMATLRAVVNSNLDARKRPAIMMERMNRLLYDSTSPEEFATAFYAVVELKSGVVRYANAGHEYPCLVTSPDVQQLEHSGIVLGCVQEFEYEEDAVTIPRGGALVLYTDGVTDAETSGGESFGQERLLHALRTNGSESSARLCSSILDQVREFSRGGDYQDDLTLVVLKRD